MAPFWTGHPLIESDLEEVRRTILGRAATEDPEVHAAVSHLFSSSGKR
jgi:hypothetical protein